MAYQLVAEVLDHAPPMTAAERLVLVTIAEQARLKTRECDLDTASLERRTGGLDPSNVRAALRRLAKRGIEVRVPFGVDRAGKPIYAHRGQVPRYRLPSFPPPSGCRCDICRNQDESAVDEVVDDAVDEQQEGGRSHPPYQETAGHEGGRTRPPTQEGGRRNTEGGRSDTEGGRSATDPVAQHPPYPSETGTVIYQRPPIVAYLSSRTSATDDETEILIHTIKDRFRPRSLGAYVRAMPDEDLADLLAEQRATQRVVATIPPPCGECGPGRLRELPDGTPYRCPECHPRAMEESA